MHGGYSFLSSGRLPEHRRYVLAYLTAAREQLIKDIGGTETNLTAGQVILIDRVIAKLGILRCLEEHVRETSVMRGDHLAPSLSENYLAYSNSLRLDLLALGINQKQADEALDLGKYIAEKAKAEKRSEARARRKEKLEAKDPDPGEETTL